MDFSDRLKEALRIRNTTAAELARRSGVNEGAISQYKKGVYKASQENLDRIAQTLDVSIPWLMGAEVPMNKAERFISPNISENIVTFPVVGNIAAGYEELAVEDWSGDTIDIPRSYLNGRNKDDFFVLSVKGDSMYPIYHDGDKVLVLKQTTLDRSGDIGAIIYDDECATLKKIEFINGEDWIRLIPLNPLYKPKEINGENLEHCRVIGIPKLLVRQIKS